jgi:hypothetical protein
MGNTEEGASTSDVPDVSTAPYDVMDKVETSTMKFEHQSRNGDRYYERPAQIDRSVDADKIIGQSHEDVGQMENQEYFYRAMKREEYDAWQVVFKQETPELRARKYVELKALQKDGHHGWASFRQYSVGYLSKGEGYTHLLEVHAPGFVTDMRSIGFKSGKAESGDMSWGMGPKSSNSFGPDRDARRLLKEAYEEAQTKGLLLPNDKKGQDREMAKLLAPYFFCKDMQSMKTVNIRSTQSKPTAGMAKVSSTGGGSNAKKGRGGGKR